MNVYVWKRIDQAADRYHEEGGVVVFAETLARAVELAAEQGALIRANEIPDEVRETFGKEAVYIMPDAGCCV